MVETFTFITMLERERENKYSPGVMINFHFFMDANCILQKRKGMKKLGWAWDRRVKETGCSKTVQYINKTKLPCVSGC